MSLRDRVHCLCTPEMPRNLLDLTGWCHNDLHGREWHLNLVLKGPSNVSLQEFTLREELLSTVPCTDTASSGLQVMVV